MGDFDGSLSPPSCGVIDRLTPRRRLRTDLYLWPGLFWWWQKKRKKKKGSAEHRAAKPEALLKALPLMELCRFTLASNGKALFFLSNDRVKRNIYIVMWEKEN